MVVLRINIDKLTKQSAPNTVEDSDCQLTFMRNGKARINKSLAIILCGFSSPDIFRKKYFFLTHRVSAGK